MTPWTHSGVHVLRSYVTWVFWLWLLFLEDKLSEDLWWNTLTRFQMSPVQWCHAQGWNNINKNSNKNLILDIMLLKKLIGWVWNISTSYTKDSFNEPIIITEFIKYGIISTVWYVWHKFLTLMRMNMSLYTKLYHNKIWSSYCRNQ